MDLRFEELICRSPNLDICICIFRYLGVHEYWRENLCHGWQVKFHVGLLAGNRSLTATVYIHITVGHKQAGQHLFGKLYYLIILLTFSCSQLGMSRENKACFLPLGPVISGFLFLKVLGCLWSFIALILTVRCCKWGNVESVTVTLLLLSSNKFTHRSEKTQNTGAEDTFTHDVFVSVP